MNQFIAINVWIISIVISLNILPRNQKGEKTPMPIKKFVPII